MNRRQFNTIVSMLPVAGAVLGASSVRAVDEQATAKQYNMDLFQIEAIPRKTDYPTRTIGHLSGYEPKTGRKFGSYLGIPSNKTKKTGFWHVEKHGDRFWLVDPEGNLNIHRAIETIRPGGGEVQKQAFDKKFGTQEKWANETVDLLRENGFNGIGGASDWKTLQNSQSHRSAPMGNTVILSLMSRYGQRRTTQAPGNRKYPNDCIFVFEPEFEEYCDRAVSEQVAEFKNDRNLLGYWTDNELPFMTFTLNGYLNISNRRDPGRLAAERWLEERNIARDQIHEKVRAEFLGFVGETYSSITAKAIRRHDPNHLNLGPRLYGDNRDKPLLMHGIAKHIDVISYNYYGLWTPLEAHTKGWTELTGKPFLISEWYTKGEDSGLPNKSGAGWIVKTQKDRGFFYQNYTLALLESKNCVGWHWFRYQDNDPTQKRTINLHLPVEDSNKGIVNNEYEPYAELMRQMKQINSQVYDLAEYFDNNVV